MINSVFKSLIFIYHGTWYTPPLSDLLRTSKKLCATKSLHLIANNSPIVLLRGKWTSVFSLSTKKDYTNDEAHWAALMARAQQGDQHAYQQLLNEISTVIQRYLTSRFGTHDFIEDCVQESLLAIHHARHTYENGRPFRPWMFAIVRNKTIDMLRKQRSYQKNLDNHAESTQLNTSHNDDNFNSNTEDSIIHGRLINALAPPFKQAIVLTKLIGLTNAEAAKQLAISEAALKVRVHRGINKLKNLIENDAL